MIFLIRQFLQEFVSSRITHILVVFQNNNELRSAGGYITQVLDMAVGRWSLRSRFLDVNTDLIHLKYEEPPEAMKELLKVHKVQFRDANYSPDFRESAQRMIKLYGHTFPDHAVSQVVALNFSFLENLLNLLGGVQAGGHVWNHKNLFFEMSAIVSNIDLHDPDARKERKKVLRLLSPAVLKACFLRFWRWPGLVKLFWASVADKDIQIFFRDVRAQQKLEQREMSIPFEPGNYRDGLGVIDNNYLGIKSNRYIRRQVHHDVRFDFDEIKKALGDAHVHVSVVMDHFGGSNYPLSGLYQSCLSLWIPQSAQNIYVPEQGYKESVHGDFRVIELRNLLPAGEQRVFTLTYTLPAIMFVDGSYSFRYLSQSGVKNETIFETVRFPEYYFAESQELMVRENTALSNHLTGTHAYTVKATFHHESPRIFYHEIVGPQTIEVRFNEPVTFAKAGEEAVSIADKESGRKVNINAMEFTNDNRRLFIHTENLPQEKERFYQLTLSNLKNLAGIPLTPFPRTVTVVYRPRHFRS